EAHELHMRAEDLIQRRLPASLWRANLANLQPRGNSAEITNHLYHAMRGRGSVYLFGGVGAGKSTMTAACFRALAHRGVEVWWDTAADLFGALKETWKSGAQTGEADLLRWRVEAATHGAFFLDDLGVGKIQPWELAALSALVDKLYTARRHDGGRPWIWLTSNRSLDGLRKWLTRRGGPHGRGPDRQPPGGNGSAAARHRQRLPAGEGSGAMKERPIIFSGPMVRAILDGRKAQTRRIMKPPPPVYIPGDPPPSMRDKKHIAPYFDAYCGGKKTDKNPQGQSGFWCWWDEYDRQGEGLKCPYGVPGDRLWVRETWQPHPEAGSHFPEGSIPSDAVCYAADNTTRDYEDSKPWKPSIHMPRWASRITLEITNVRAERLHDISWDDALAEGIDRLVDRYDEPDVWRDYSSEGPPEYTSDPIESYATLWESIHGSGAWDKNPWVWVLEFKRVEAGR
ncbi:MAG: hypothetical protein OEV92_04475, partial [Nitrospinota bacterium]|nr:hypothetical protein [Nitrospinota bacterium]